MESMKRCLTGRHNPAEIRCHLALLAVVYWILIYFAWRGYTSQHPYSIMKQTFSALGSFDQRNNPEWYWVFTVAMVYCGATMIPIILYIRRKIAAISEVGAWVGSLLFIMGCIAIILTGLFPDAGGKVIGSWEWRHIHLRVAVMIAIGFGTGILWHAALLIYDMFARGTFSDTGNLPYLKLLGPFSITFPIFITAGYRLNWGYFYGAIYAFLQSSHEEMKTYWEAAVEGLQSFPVLEHLAIWGLTLFVIWFAAVLPYQTDQDQSRHYRY